MAERIIKKSVCRMCGGGCGIDAILEDGKLVEIKGNPDDLFNHGRVCIKGSSAVQNAYHPDRLKKALKKTENGFVEIEIEQAMDEIAEKVKEIQKKYGERSVAVWKGEGTGFAQNEDLFRRFIHAIGSPNYFSNDTQCWAGRNLGYTLVHGAWPEPQYEDTRLLFVWGSNPPNMQSYWMQQINIGREKGAKLVVFDTRYSEIARQADIHVQMRPGTDCVIAYAIIKEIITQGLTDDEFISKYTVGFEQLKEYAMTFTPEFVEKETGVPYQTILDVVALIKERAPKMGNWCGTGIEHQTNGNSNIRAAVIIDTLVGACDIPGGMYYPVPFPVRSLTIYDEKPLLELNPIGRDKHPALYDSRQECHTLELMDTLITEKPYPIKAMLLTAANPVLTNARSQKVVDGFKNLDLLVVKDLFLTETAEIADYVLPAASSLEREELCYQPKKHVVQMRQKVLNFGLQDEYDFIKGLADRLGASSYFPWKDEEELIDWLLEPTGVKKSQILNSPTGFYQYGPLEYRKFKKRASRGEKPFDTPSGKIEYYSEYLAGLGYTGIPRYVRPTYLENPSKEYPYLLISGCRKIYYMHGRYRNLKHLNDIQPEGYVEMHPEDAEEIGVKTGEYVRVTTKNGSVELQVRVMHERELVKGSMQITHGFNDQNVNWLTSDDERDPVSGFPALKSIQANIEKV